MIEDHLGNLMRRFGYKSGIANIPSQMAAPVEDDPTRLNVGNLVEIRAGEYQVADDGTIVVDGKRTFIYIGNPSNYMDKISTSDISTLPRYHFTECSTISKMAENGRAGRYVRPKIPDGQFTLLLVIRKKEEIIDSQLYPCGNCMRTQFPEVPFSERSTFTVEQFFAKYPLHCASKFITSRKSILEAHHNVYAKNFKGISIARRSKKECEGCWGKFEPGDLDLHHLDGDASNNSELNLKVLCVHCHVNEPNHSHYRALLQKTGRLDAFYRLYPKRQSSSFI